MNQYLFVMLGGALGSLFRFLVYQYYFARGVAELFYATLTVNMIGCFLVGVFFSHNEQQLVSSSIRLLVLVGFLGAFTTYSAFSLELMQMIRSGTLLTLFFYLAGSIAMGILMVYCGMRVGEGI